MDKSFKLTINGTNQRVRLSGSRDGLPPVLIVQAGPGFPLLNEVAKFRDRLNLESSFTVAYWDQRVLADSGCIERGMRFGDLLRGLLFSLNRTYGLFGVISAVRNMNAIQGKLLPELAALDLFADWRPLTIPTHYIFGDCDPLVTPCMRKKLQGLMACHDTLISTPEAGHMVQFDAPSVVRSGVDQAHAS